MSASCSQCGSHRNEEVAMETRKWPLTSAVRTETLREQGRPRADRTTSRGAGSREPRCPAGRFHGHGWREAAGSHRDTGLRGTGAGQPRAGQSRSPAGQVTGAGTPHLRVAGTPVTAGRAPGPVLVEREVTSCPEHGSPCVPSTRKCPKRPAWACPVPADTEQTDRWESEHPPPLRGARGPTET